MPKSSKNLNDVGYAELNIDRPLQINYSEQMHASNEQPTTFKSCKGVYVIRLITYFDPAQNYVVFYGRIEAILRA